jgi:hypothetical protein
LNKTQLTLLILLIVLFSALPIAYGVYPPIRPAVNNFFGAIIPSITYWATAGWIWFIGLPYWPVLLFVGALLIGIMIDRFAWKTLISIRQSMTRSAIRDSGLAPRQTRPVASPVIQQTPQPAQTTEPPADTTVLAESE